MRFWRFIRILNNRDNEDIINSNKFMKQEIIVLKKMVAEGRKQPTHEERRLLGIHANEIRKIIRNPEVECMFQPETILKWFRQYANNKFDGSKNRKTFGRPKLKDETKKLIIQLAEGNRTWGANRIVGQLKALGIKVSDQTVLNVLKENHIPIAPDRKKELTWKQFLKNHARQIWACDFILMPIFTLAGVKHFHIFVFIQHYTRQLKIAAIKEQPNGEYIEQIARNLTDCFEPKLPDCKYLIHDRDSLFTKKFDRIFKDFGIEPLKTPPQSPNLNAFAERVIRSIKEECLTQQIILGENSLKRMLKEYEDHYNNERPHQGIGNEIINQNETLIHSKKGEGEILKKERLGGLLNYYYRKSA